MRQFTVVVAQDFETGLFVGYVPGFPIIRDARVSVEDFLSHRQVSRVAMSVSRDTSRWRSQIPLWVQASHVVVPG